MFVELTTSPLACSGLSWHADYMRVGMLVMYVHDVSDIFIDVLKMSNLIKLEGPRGWFISEIAYVATLVSWAYYRLYQFPFRVMHSSYYFSYSVTSANENSDNNASFFGLFRADLPLLVHNNVLLGLLLCLHFYWFYMLLRVGYRIITESVTQASRMEYEGDSDIEDEVSKVASIVPVEESTAYSSSNSLSTLPAAPNSATESTTEISPRRGVQVPTARDFSK